jgi:ABC-type lipoprotein release transport system permease subunit
MTLDALASGLVGAFIGVGAAVLLQWQRDRLDGRAVARAVYMEIVANTLPLMLAMDSGVYAPLTDSTWLAALSTARSRRSLNARVASPSS